MGSYFKPTKEDTLTFKNKKALHQDAKRWWINQANEGQCRTRGDNWEKGGIKSRMRERALGVPQKEQSSGSRKQTVLHTGQEDGKGFWNRQNACVWNVKILGCSSQRFVRMAASSGGHLKKI